MPTISLRVPDEEFAIFKSFARHSNTSVSEMIRQTVLERIETEYDLSIFAEYEEQKESGELDTCPISELWDELGI
ncbi:type II toxin-antitoxin system RelB family antitoxin [Trueperella pyogenes]|uniref:type II toxin-antitoxin system RelB family antitoxin n=1 Tax=Trueperella pyogenes TaxID=1661 RepID=UPI00345D4469